MTTDQWLHVLGLLVLFFFSAFFSSSETALMSMDRLRVKYLAEKARPSAKSLETLLSKPDDLLSAVSELEKKAEKTKRTKSPRTCSH